MGPRYKFVFKCVVIAFVILTFQLRDGRTQYSQCSSGNCKSRIYLHLKHHICMHSFLPHWASAQALQHVFTGGI